MRIKLGASSGTAHCCVGQANGSMICNSLDCNSSKIEPASHVVAEYFMSFISNRKSTTLGMMEP